MSYPQPNSNQPVLQGQDFLRILTPLASAGDIYQSEQAGYVFQVGPDSDIARVNVTYFDPSLPSFTNNIVISNKTPFYGRLDARNTDTYQPSGVPGRILFSPADIIPNSVASAIAVDVIQGVFDVIEYFTPRTISPLRNDKDYFFYDLNYSAGGYEVYIPSYGRSYVEVQARDPNTTGASIQVDGFKWGLGSSSTQVTSLLASVAIGAGQQAIINSAAKGFFDHIRVKWTGGTGLTLPTRVILSDVPQ